jgi:hypothetical protein
MRMVSVSYPQTRFRVVSMLSYLNVVVVHCIHFSISPSDSVHLGRLFHKCRAFRDSMLIIIVSNVSNNNMYFFVRHSEFENFLLCERILINVTTCQNETSS